MLKYTQTREHQMILKRDRRSEVRLGKVRVGGGREILMRQEKQNENRDEYRILRKKRYIEN